MSEAREPAFVAKGPKGMAAELKFRMSGLARVCPRMYALAVMHSGEIMTDSEVIDPELGWIFGTGTAIHHQFQNAYLQALGDVFQGWWRCRECGHVHRGEVMDGMLSHRWIPKPKHCAQYDERISDECQSVDFEYVELEFANPEYRITGHCDGILDWRVYVDPAAPLVKFDAVEVLELKTINDYGFKAVDPMAGGVPKPDHVLQCNGYLWALEDTEVTHARIVYIGKDFTKKMAESIVEHRIARSAGYIDALKRMLRDSVSSVERIAEWVCSPVDERPEVELPLRLRLCTKRSDKRAKDCPAKALCFPKKTKRK